MCSPLIRVGVIALPGVNTFSGEDFKVGLGKRGLRIQTVGTVFRDACVPSAEENIPKATLIVQRITEPMRDERIISRVGTKKAYLYYLWKALHNASTMNSGRPLIPLNGENVIMYWGGTETLTPIVAHWNERGWSLGVSTFNHDAPWISGVVLSVK